MIDQDTHADEALREAILGYADMVLAKADEWLNGGETDRRIVDTNNLNRLRTLRQMRNRMDLAFAQGVGIYNDDYHALRATIERGIHEIEKAYPMASEETARRERTVAGGLP